MNELASIKKVGIKILTGGCPNGQIQINVTKNAHVSMCVKTTDILLLHECDLFLLIILAYNVRSKRTAFSF